MAEHIKYIVQWHSVDDILPKDRWQDHLVVQAGGRVSIACCDSGAGKWTNEDGDEVARVTHWCAIPEPPST